MQSWLDAQAHEHGPISRDEQEEQSSGRGPSLHQVPRPALPELPGVRPEVQRAGAEVHRAVLMMMGGWVRKNAFAIFQNKLRISKKVIAAICYQLIISKLVK